MAFPNYHHPRTRDELNEYISEHLQRFDPEFMNGLSDRVQLAVQSAMVVAARAAIENVNEVVWNYAALCASDIEHLFLVGLTGRDYVHFPYVERWEDHPWKFLTDPDGMMEFLKERYVPGGSFPIGVLMQVPVLQYRVDFFLYGISPRILANGECEWKSSIIVVECDGHEFHERTKKQAQRDKSRDRAITAQGFDVLRFTGSEIWADPYKCAEEALRLMYRRQNGAI